MTDIDLKFSPENAQRAVDGWKNSSARDEKKGEPGDEFKIDGVRFRLLDVLYLPVTDIAFNYYRCEGFDNFVACMAELHRIYPDKRYDDRLYLHFFARCGQ